MDIGSPGRAVIVDPVEDPVAAVAPVEPDRPPPLVGNRVLQAPDYAEPIEGWRLWLVFERECELRLASVLYDVEWPVGRPLEAGCLLRRRSAGWQRASDRRRHAAPAEGCRCGIYALAEPTHLSAYLDANYPGGDAVQWVIGTVMLWGQVVAAESGWRGAVAYPSRLYVPCPAGRDETSTAVADALQAYAPVDLLDRDGIPRAMRGVAGHGAVR